MTHEIRGKTPPKGAHHIVQWNHHDKSLVLQWLVMNLAEDCVLTPNNLAAVDAKGYWRWRISSAEYDLRVLLERPEDVQLFEMTWL